MKFAGLHPGGAVKARPSPAGPTWARRPAEGVFFVSHHIVNGGGRCAVGVCACACGEGAGGLNARGSHLLRPDLT